eukprot:scaffold3467_cov120-Isochrysis_galbana.AAC.2
MGALGRGGVLLPHEGDVANLSIAYEEGICRSSWVVGDERGQLRSSCEEVAAIGLFGLRCAVGHPGVCAVHTSHCCCGGGDVGSECRAWGGPGPAAGLVADWKVGIAGVRLGRWQAGCSAPCAQALGRVSSPIEESGNTGGASAEAAADGGAPTGAAKTHGRVLTARAARDEGAVPAGASVASHVVVAVLARKPARPRIRAVDTTAKTSDSSEPSLEASSEPLRAARSSARTEDWKAARAGRTRQGGCGLPSSALDASTRSTTSTLSTPCHCIAGRGCAGAAYGPVAEDDPEARRPVCRAQWPPSGRHCIRRPAKRRGRRRDVGLLAPARSQSGTSPQRCEASGRLRSDCELAGLQNTSAPLAAVRLVDECQRASHSAGDSRAALEAAAQGPQPDFPRSACAIVL